MRLTPPSPEVLANVRRFVQYRCKFDIDDDWWSRGLDSESCRLEIVFPWTEMLGTQPDWYGNGIDDDTQEPDDQEEGNARENEERSLVDRYIQFLRLGKHNASAIFEETLERLVNLGVFNQGSESAAEHAHYGGMDDSQRALYWEAYAQMRQRFGIQDDFMYRNECLEKVSGGSLL